MLDIRFVRENAELVKEACRRRFKPMDEVVDELVVGIQPTSLVMDCNNKLWTVTDGGYEGSPYGHEAPSLYRIDAETFIIEKQFKFKFGDWPSEVQLNGTKDKLYWLNDDVWMLDLTKENAQPEIFLPYDGTLYYGLTICPHTGDVYIADAIDYVQQGMVYRYSKDVIQKLHIYAKLRLCLIGLTKVRVAI